ncbi:MAG: AI-2E family transporter [Ottowia sp.]|uniref:AI-2E family transporter n=1 Tax=Ottowia sp. TaxID=1898956 RepID=UPI003C709414
MAADTLEPKTGRPASSNGPSLLGPESGLHSPEEAEDPLYESAPRAPLMNSLVSLAIIVAALYFGRDLLVPLAFAILISFVLDPVVTWLKRFRIPRGAAVTLVVTAALGLIVATGFLAFTQLRQIGNNLPTYETTITKKLRDFRRDLRKPGLLDQYSRVFGKVQKEINAAQAPLGPRAAAPTQVEVVRDAAKPMDRVVSWVETFVPTIAAAGIVIVFVFLILLDRGDLRDRFLRLMGGNLGQATTALSEASERVSKYLTMQLIVNATYGLPMTIGLLLIGVPGALVWGVLAALLRFVPYAGPLIAAVFPLTLAFAVDPGWNMVLWTLALILTLELVSNNIIEPWLYGSSTGISTLSLILAAMFWTALWGPMGLLLSTPITVVLLVAGRYVPALHFLEVLLGSERALDEPTRLHQRLLAGDVDEAVELAEDYAEKTSPENFYAKVGLNTLRLATSAYGTAATAQHRHRVVSGMGRVIEELREQYPPKPDLPTRIACIGGRWTADTLAAEMAAHTLALHGFGSRAVPAGIISAEHIGQLDLQDIEVVCLCYFSPAPAIHARFFVRRLKRQWPHIQFVLAAWNHAPDTQDATPTRTTGAEALVTSLDELLADAESRIERVSLSHSG